MSKVLITGGAGFIGSHLAQELVRQGIEIVIIDNLRTGKLENLSGIKHMFINADIRDYNALKSALEGCGRVYHLAALTSVIESMDKIEECISINLKGTLNILRAAQENRIQKVFFASTVNPLNSPKPKE